MALSLRTVLLPSALLTALLLAACGGGGGSSAPPVETPPITEPGAPQATGNTATDGFNWFNYRRKQLGEVALVRNSKIDIAAQGHSNYQSLNDTITHTQTVGNPGFTGVNELDRLTAAGYQFTQGGYAYGEVISATGDAIGFNAAEDLITAIYHRFVIFEPKFKEGGAGAATTSAGYTYMTVDFTANGLNGGLGNGKFVVYPIANQSNVPRNFFSDQESPDPVPSVNQVGYPISIHADITSSVTVQSFTVKPRGGAAMAVRLLSAATDTETPQSNAAIIPLSVLAAATTYDVQFTGTVDGVAATRSWSFTTR